MQWWTRLEKVRILKVLVSASGVLTVLSSHCPRWCRSLGSSKHVQPSEMVTVLYLVGVLRLVVLPSVIVSTISRHYWYY